MIGKRLVNTGGAVAAFDALQNFETVTYTGNSSTQKITGYIRKGAAFNGSSSEISNTVGATSTTSFSMWVKFNSTSQNSYLQVFDNNDYGIFAYNGKLNVQYASGSTSNGVAWTIANTTDWFHIAGTFTSSSSTLYVNGVQKTESMSNWINAGNEPHIGNRADGTGSFNGLIDQVRIFNKALSSSEVTTLYGETYASSTKSTADIFNDGSAVALYELDEDANDSSGTLTPLDIDDIDFANKKVFDPTDMDSFTTPGCAFGDSGNRLYAGDEYSAGIIREYALSTPYDISTAASTATGSKDLDESYLYGLKVVSSTRIFAIENNNVIEYQMSTPWSISTATSTSNKFLKVSMGSALGNASFQAFDFNSDGTKLIASYQNTTTSQAAFEIFNLATAYDISGLAAATPATTSGWMTVSYDLHRGLYWSEDEDQVFYVGLTGQAFQFDFATAGDASTITLTKTRNMSYGNLGGFEWYPDQNILLTASETNTNYVQASWSKGNYNGTPTNVNFLGMAFQPDLVWVKTRTQPYSNSLFDSIRGTGTDKQIYSDETLEEGNRTDITNFVSFDTNGFTVGATTHANNILNKSGEDLVAWCWKAGGVPTPNNNTEGDITSTVSANQDAGFSIVKYAGGNSSGTTVGHGLTQPIELLIVKNLNDGSDNWVVWHKDVEQNSTSNSTFTLKGGSILLLNSASATIPSYTYDGQMGSTSGESLIAYCFHSVDSYQRIGSYTGDGGTNKRIYTDSNGDGTGTGAFAPRWIMIKRTDTPGYSWVIQDTTRGVDVFLQANLSDIEGSAASIDIIQINTDGFTHKSANYHNVLNGTYIYLAIA